LFGDDDIDIACRSGCLVQYLVTQRHLDIGAVRGEIMNPGEIRCISVGENIN
jgi:hypothetical protein